MDIFSGIKKIEKKIRRRIVGYVKLKKRKLTKNNRMPFLQLHLADHCNLNCKGCAHFSPVAEKHLIDLDDLEKMYRNLQPFLETWFSRFELMGGEPLLHPQIEEILDMTRAYFPKMEIRLVTNGINLLEMNNSFFWNCAKNNIIVYISMYPIHLDYKAIYGKLDRYGVRHSRYGEYDICKTFINYRLNTQGCYNRKKNYQRCKLGGRCLQLKENRIYPCFSSAYAEHLNRYFHTGFEWEQGDYLSLDQPVTEEQFRNFINEPVPFCRYCDIKHQSTSEWGLSKKSASEWISGRRE